MIQLTSKIQGLLQLLPYIIASINILLCLKFHRTTCLLISTLSIGLLLYQSQPIVHNHIHEIGIIALLISNALFCCLFQDVHFFTLRNLLKWSLLAAQVSAAVWLTQHSDVLTPVTAWLQQKAPVLNHLSQADWILYSMLSASVILFFRAYPSSLRQSYFGAFIALFLAFHYSHEAWLFQSLITTALSISLFGLLSHLHSIAFYDDLTQIPARRALNERLAGLTGHYCIAMIDIDHFKKFNDTYGHDMGDKVLNDVARTIKKCVGQNAYRYGGEEFTIVFSSGNFDKAMDKLEQVREAVESRIIKSNKGKTKKNVSVTISIGCALKMARQTPNDVVKNADKALYKAKKKGRNQVCS